MREASRLVQWMTASLLLATLASCNRLPQTRAPLAGTIRIDGSQGVMPLVAALATEYRRLHPSVAVEMGNGLGSRARLDSLKSGRIDIALSSLGTDREEMTRQGVIVHEIARVAVVFAVNQGVSVANVTTRHVCDLYSGTVTNWRALGGPDLAVAARTRPVGEVDGDVVAAGISCFRNAVASGAPRALALPEDMAADLATTPGAIGMTSVPFVQRSGGRLRALSLNGIVPNAETVRSGAYPLARAAFLLVRNDASETVRHFIAFTRSAEAARIIAENGGVAVR